MIPVSKIKQIVLIGAIFCFLVITGCTIILYSHYGPLTPNGNRYYHHFNMDTVEWSLVVVEMAAMASLIYPSVRYGLSSNSELHQMGIFPSISKFGCWVSLFLTILCIGSQLGYTIGYSAIVYEYVTKHFRVMAEDLETGIQYLAYLGCIGFWGLVNTIYSMAYKFKWQ